MRTQLLHEPEDIQWLRETHLRTAKGIPEFASAVLHGNEDSPDKIELYASSSPLVTDRPVYVWTDYLERVQRNLKGCEAISTGTCPGCDECRHNWDAYRVHEDYGPDDILRFTFKASNEEASSHPPTLVYYATDEEAEAASREAFNTDVRNGECDDEGGFSKQGCGICDNRYGQTLYVWHYVDKQDKIRHNSDCCADCMNYLANDILPGEA